MKKFLSYILLLLIHLLLHTGAMFAQNTDSGAGNVRLLPPVAVDAPLDSVTVTGVDSLTLAELDGVILSHSGGIINSGLIEHDVEAITTYLHEQGWWSAAVTAKVDSSASQPTVTVLSFKVFPGELRKFGRFTAEQAVENGFGITDDSLPDVYGKTFTKDAFEQAIDDIMTHYLKQGYPDTDVRPLMTARKDTVDVLLRIQAGERAHIDSIVVEGLTKTRDYVVIRELKQLIGKPAGPVIAADALTAVQRLSFVRPHGTPAITYTPDGLCLLVIDLEERGQGSFDGVVGYQPSDNGEKGEVIGTINLDLANMFGTGRSSAIRWEKLGKQTEDLEFSYIEPRIFGFPYTISGAFLQEERERLGYTLTRIDVKIGRYIGHLHIDTGFRYEKVSADSLTSTHAAGLEVSAVWEDIDNSDNPRSGLRYSSSWSLLSKKYRFDAKDDTSIDRISFDLDHYIPTIKRQTVALLVRYRRTSSDKDRLEPADRYWIGGASTLRGYREQQFPAVKALWSSLEYRFLTGGTSRFFVFADTGYLIDYVKSPNGSTYDKNTLTRTGYGFGLRIQSRAGTLGFDYGLGQGDSPGQGKLHVRLSAEF